MELKRYVLGIEKGIIDTKGIECIIFGYLGIETNYVVWWWSFSFRYYT